MVVLGFLTNGLNLFLPKVIASGIDIYQKTNLISTSTVWTFFWLSVGTFVFAYLQSVAQTYTSEKVALDLRNKIVEKISKQDYMYIQKVTAGKLLTNLTSDVDNIKGFVGQAVVTIISSIFLVLGASVLMVMIDWKLGLSVLITLPLISLTFMLVFKKLKPLFTRSQEVIDWLNKIINESILGSAIVRVLNSKDLENTKFASANQKAADLGVEQVNIFATTFPVIGFIANGASLIILLLGGHFIITGEMTVGNFTAFIAYLGLIVFPLIMIGFLSSSISSAAASYARVSGTLNSEDKKDTGTIRAQLAGDIEIENVNVSFGEKNILKNINLKVKAGSRTAILGPTAAGKTHLMYLLIGILAPNTGVVKYDGKDINTYDSESIHEQVGLVFQDSIMFNLSLRENIAFNKKVTDADITKALQTAELSDFVESLPGGLDTMVMERGTSLSGGQKQRIMLARALALNPKVLLLDDFTARVDNTTERKILKNVRTNYPDVTLVSVTQKISSIEDFEQIIVLMEGEILATGTHAELMKKSTEYVQIFDSQKSTNHYELQT
jgi:ATP-binding cassette subfamily B protein